MGEYADLSTAHGRAKNAIWLLSLPDKPEVIDARRQHAISALAEALGSAWESGQNVGLGWSLAMQAGISAPDPENPYVDELGDPR